MKRREFLILPARTLGGYLLASTLAGEPFLAQAQQAKAPDIKIPLKFFTAPEAAVVSAMTERIFPTDANGAGAREAGVVIFIDRQLAGPYGHDKYRYTKGPWVESIPEHGYQGQSNPRQIYREGITQLGNFATLGAAEQDQALIAIEKTTFFQMVRTHTLEGMFCDPLHGGNADMVGWRLIGYPGPVMAYRHEIEKYRGVPYPKVEPQSLEQLLGRKVPAWEDEPV